MTGMVFSEFNTSGLNMSLIQHQMMAVKNMGFLRFTEMPLENIHCSPILTAL